jgi:23S rRNA pseudouridine2605 synthase
MRINRFVAQAIGLSRRAADSAIISGRVLINNQVAILGDQVAAGDSITLDAATLQLPTGRTVMLHKPVGYISSRRQQGAAPTIYALLPEELHTLKPVGRLDRDSSGLLLLTNDGALAQQLQHPSHGKTKRYLVWLNRPLAAAELKRLSAGVRLSDGLSRMQVEPHAGHYIVSLQEGRNRQIRRSFAALNRRVTKLHRTEVGSYRLERLQPGSWRELTAAEATV